jgi:hypothetical protein
MSGHTRKTFLSLKEYLDRDAVLPDARQHFQGIMNDLKNLRGPSRDQVFAAAMKELCDFVSHFPETFHGRALLYGIPLQGNVMMPIENSLVQFLGTCQRILNSNLKKMGWTAIKSNNIGYRSLVSYFGTRIFIKALRHQMTIHVRVFTKSVWAPTAAQGREAILNSVRQTSDLSLSMMDEMLAGAGSALGPMELDEDLVAQVAAASIEDADESPEFLNSKIAPADYCRREESTGRENQRLQDANSEARSRLSARYTTITRNSRAHFSP